MSRKRYCLALDLVDDKAKIQQYIDYHQKIWPEITQSIHDSGINHMEIYRVEDRLFMIIDTDENFSFERKSQMDQSNARVAEWEELMDQFQQRLPNTPDGTKWRLMEKIFDLQENG